MADSVEIGADLKRLLSEKGLSLTLEASIAGGMWYTRALEKGSSQQAPQGMWRVYVPNYREILETEIAAALQRAIKANRPLGPALEDGFRRGVIKILRELESKTPIKTGRARSSWVATLPSGRKVNAKKWIGSEAQYQRMRRAIKRMQRL